MKRHNTEHDRFEEPYVPAWTPFLIKKKKKCTKMVSRPDVAATITTQSKDALVACPKNSGRTVSILLLSLEVVLSRASKGELNKNKGFCTEAPTTERDTHARSELDTDRTHASKRATAAEQLCLDRSHYRYCSPYRHGKATAPLLFANTTLAATCDQASPSQDNAKTPPAYMASTAHTCALRLRVTQPPALALVPRPKQGLPLRHVCCPNDYVNYECYYDNR